MAGGYPPQPGLGYPPQSRTGVPTGTGYAAGGMPRAVSSRRTFLFIVLNFVSGSLCI